MNAENHHWKKLIDTNHFYYFHTRNEAETKSASWKIKKSCFLRIFGYKIIFDHKSQKSRRGKVDRYKSSDRCISSDYRSLDLPNRTPCIGLWYFIWKHDYLVIVPAGILWTGLLEEAGKILVTSHAWDTHSSAATWLVAVRKYQNTHSGNMLAKQHHVPLFKDRWRLFFIRTIWSFKRSTTNRKEKLPTW